VRQAVAKDVWKSRSNGVCQCGDQLGQLILDGFREALRIADHRLPAPLLFAGMERPVVASLPGLERLPSVRLRE
jgi:hypothetical protein